MIFLAFVLGCAISAVLLVLQYYAPTAFSVLAIFAIVFLFAKAFKLWRIARGDSKPKSNLGKMLSRDMEKHK